jgi:DNA-directed RNA polymerase specialized sigma24 family protein
MQKSEVIIPESRSSDRATPHIPDVTNGRPKEAGIQPLHSTRNGNRMRQRIRLAWRTHKIQTIMNQLPPREREILCAFFLEERDKSEICRAMGLSEIQFRVVLFRAKEKFREIYRLSLKRNVAKQH